MLLATAGRMALTQKQTQELHHAIEHRRAALLVELREDVEKTRQGFEDHAGPASDAGDESVASLMADLDHAELGRDLSELRELEAARTRLADGNYGICADCGGDIGFERLRATPAAVRCVDCQRVHEKTYAGPNTSSL
ncbi:MAG TPA: TraR/DksA family transcriptional regulator [Burkholderiales bacterium]|nr:TraR/DksA family transcriptional regulator [Burkholderiales bacterium]